MSGTERRGGSPQPPQEGLRNLREIDRPHSLRVGLQYNGQSLLVGKDIILTHMWNPSTGFTEVMIDRQKSEYIAVLGDPNADKVYTPYHDAESRRGKVSGLFIAFRQRRPLAYVGEKYAIRFQERNEDIVVLEITSPEPIDVLPLPKGTRREDHEALLLQLWAGADINRFRMTE